MNYEQARENIKRRFIIPDGYNGKTAAVGLAFLPTGNDGIAVEVTESGYYRSNNYNYANEHEMLYFYDNHAKTHFRNILKKLEATNGATK